MNLDASEKETTPRRPTGTYRAGGDGQKTPKPDPSGFVVMDSFLWPYAVGVTGEAVRLNRIADTPRLQPVVHLRNPGEKVVTVRAICLNPKQPAEKLGHG